MKSILVIEDDASYRNSMKLILQMEGFAVRTADCGVSGVAMIREKHPDLILCDIMMSGMDGHSVLEVLKNDYPIAKIPFIFVSALGDRTDVRRGMLEGADDYLTKPFTPEELISAIVARLQRISVFHQPDEPDEPADIQKKLDILFQKTTSREREILLLVGDGYTSKEISERLGIQRNTVEVHRANMMRKLDATNAANLAQWAAIAGMMLSTDE